MKTNPFKNLLKTALFMVAVLLSFVGFGQNSIDKSSYASSLASVSKTPTYRWEGLPVLEESDVKEFISPPSLATCLTLSTSVTDLVCSSDGSGVITLTVTGGAAPYVVELVSSSNPPIGKEIPVGSYTTTFTSLDADTYTINVTSADECTATTTVVVNSTNLTPVINVSGIFALCTPSETTALAATGATTYTWSTGANTASITATAPSTTTAPSNQYTVQGTANGCVSSVASVSVSLLNASNLIGVDVVSQTVCASQSATLSANGGSTYTWSPGGQTTQSIVVSPSVTTVYTVTGTNSCGSVNSATTTVITNTTSPPSPTISGSTTVCPQTNYTYTASGADTYNWAFLNAIGNATTFTISGGNITDQSTAVISLTGTSTSTGCSNTTTLTISNIAPFVHIPLGSNSDFPLGICSGSSYTINATVTPSTSSYTWSPSLTGLNPVISPTVTTTYSLQATNAGCTGQTRFFTIQVKPTPTITITSPINICSGVTTALTPAVSGTITSTIYNWSPATNLSSTSTATTVATTSTNITYTLTASNFFSVGSPDGSGRELLTCFSTQSVSINITPGPMLTISGNTYACPNHDDTLTASGAASYTWSVGTGSVTTNPLIIGVGSQLAGFSGLEMYYDSTQVFTVVGSNSSGCTSTATYTVSAPVPTFTYNLNTLDAHYDIPLYICSGTSYTLHAQVPSGDTYTWTPSLDGTLNPVISPTVSTEYILTVSNGTCTTSKPAQLNVLATPTITLVAPENICAGNSYTLNPGLAGVNGGTIYHWSPPTDLSSINTATTVATPTSSTSYSLIAGNHLFDAIDLVDDTVFSGSNISCRDTASVTINIIQTPPVPTINYSTKCDSNYTTLNIPGANSTYTYTWNGPCYNGTGSSVNVNTVGIYTVSVVNSCSVVTTNTISVLLIGNIVAGFQTHINFLEEGSQFIHFENLSLGNNLIYQWTFGNGDTSVVINPNEVFDTVGVFQVHLYDSDSLHCKDTASATVVLSGRSTILIIPNSFTPNNDNVDDVFEINGTGVTNFKCQISDGWGNFLYQWNNLNGSWNGLASGGHVFATGNYFYLLSYTDYYGNNQSRSGIVALKN